MRRLVVVAVSSFSLALLMPVSAQAQFGGLVRRAAERAVKKENPSNGQPQIDDATVAHMLTGLGEEARVADSIGRVSLAQNAAVTERVDAFLKRYAEYATARDEALRSQQEYQSCVGAPAQELSAMAQAQPATVPPDAMAFAQRLQSMSPEERDALQAKMDKLEKEAKAAEKSGNVAEQQRIRAEVQKLTGMSMTPVPGARPRSQSDVKKMQDASNRMQQCGTPKQLTVRPPEPIMVRPVETESGVAVLGPSATREIGDSSSAQEYLASLRGMHVGNTPIGRGAQAAGMDTGPYSLLRERMLYLYANAAMRGESARPDGFSDEEYDALQAHRAEIVAAAQRLKKLGAF